MLINLTKSVPLKELCRITVLGFTQDIAQQIEFSHEAMIGFATELLWMYEENKRQVICTHQKQNGGFDYGERDTGILHGRNDTGLSGI